MADTERVKAWISRYTASMREFDRLCDRIAIMRSRLEAPGSPTLSGMPHGGGYSGDTIGRTLAAVEALEAQVQEIRDRSGIGGRGMSEAERMATLAKIEDLTARVATIVEAAKLIEQELVNLQGMYYQQTEGK